MTLVYFKKYIIGNPTKFSTFHILTTRRKSYGKYEFRVLQFNRWVNFPFFITILGQKELPVLMESPNLIKHQDILKFFLEEPYS